MKRVEKVREIELLQNMLYSANMGDMSVYENGDNIIAEVPNCYLNTECLIAIPENELLLIDDETGDRYGKTFQEVYDILTDWCVIDEMNASEKNIITVLKWFVKHEVELFESHKELLKTVEKLGGKENEM